MSGRRRPSRRGARKWSVTPPTTLVVRRLIVLLAVTSAATAFGAPQALSGQSRVPRFVDCGAGRPEVRPEYILVACGDGNFYLTRLKWSRWTATGASARGTGHQNDCTPSCADGHLHTYGVAINLSRPRICAKHILEFTRFSWLFVGRKPPQARRGGTATPPRPPTDPRCA
jgi:hypothetical protein